MRVQPRRTTTTSRTARYPLSRRTTARLSAQARKKTAEKKTAQQNAHAPFFNLRIKLLANHLNGFIQQRKKEFGANDPLARTLSSIQTNISRELNQHNPLNANLVRALKRLNPALRGRGPLALRRGIPTLAQYFRQNVKKHVKQLLNDVKKSFSMMNTELKRLESKLNSEIRKAKSQKTQLKVEPSLKRRIQTLDKNLAQFKSQWTKRLNTLSLHGTQETKSAVNSTKKLLEETQRATRRNLAILNRYAKACKPKAGYQTRALFNANDARSFESKWNQVKSQVEKTRCEAECCAERLRAIKQI